MRWSRPRSSQRDMAAEACLEDEDSRAPSVDFQVLSRLCLCRRTRWSASSAGGVDFSFVPSAPGHARPASGRHAGGTRTATRRPHSGGRDGGASPGPGPGPKQQLVTAPLASRPWLAGRAGPAGPTGRGVRRRHGCNLPGHDAGRRDKAAAAPCSRPWAWALARQPPGARPGPAAARAKSALCPARYATRSRRLTTNAE